MTSTEAQSVPARSAVKNLRWWIAGLLALATALSYLDRQSFPVVVGEIRKEIPLDDTQYARLTSLFLFAYAIMYAGGGRILDWLGTRVGYAIMIVWWSAANFMLGTVNGVFGLGMFRFLLGLGEGGGFPGSGKAVAEWFPAKERSLAFGIFNTGSSVGAVIAPPLIALIVSQLGWRWVFFVTGSLGFIWALAWLKLYQPPAKNRFITEEERQYISASMDPPASPESRSAAFRPLSSTATNPPIHQSINPPRIPWLRLFTYRQVWGLMGAKFLTDSVWYFYIFWIPKYLGDVRHLNIKELGYFAWIPYAFAGLGSLIGGWLSSFLIRKGRSLDTSRKIALAISACLMPVSLLIAASPLSFAIVFLSAALFGHQFWSANVQTLPADIFPSRVVGSVEGLLGCAGSFGGMLFAELVGKLIGPYGYAPAFVMAGIFHPIGFLLILTIVRRIQRVAC